MSFRTILISVINLLGCIVLTQESSKITRFEKFKDLTYLKQMFQIWSSSGLIEMKLSEIILNNLYHHDKLPILHCSPSGSLQSLPNSQIWRFFRSYTVFSDFTGQWFYWNEWCQQYYLKKLWILWPTPEDAPFSH